ncbi:MAG: hypothetical protein QM755_10385 [Luteolibacter sp.]
MAFALTLSELARLTGGDIVRGGLDSSYSGMAALDAAGVGDISFLGNERVPRLVPDHGRRCRAGSAG